MRPAADSRWSNTRLLVHPVILGAGTPYWPKLDAPIRLRLTDTHRFASGVLYLGYAAA